MPVTSAKTGMKATFSIGNGVDGGSTTYAKIGEVTSIGPPGITREAIDVTHLESPDDAREFIPGLLDAEPSTVGFNYVPDAADPVYALMRLGKGDFRLTWPNGVKMDWSGIPTNWTPGDVNTTTMAGELTTKPSGLPVFTAA